MNKFLWSCAALLTVFVAVQSLTCNTCKVGLLGYCFADKHINCTAGTTMCFSAVAKFSADFMDIHEKGCAKADTCRNETGHILNVNYTVTTHCCTSNLCNKASSVQLPLSAALVAALVALLSI